MTDDEAREGYRKWITEGSKPSGAFDRISIRLDAWQRAGEPPHYRVNVWSPGDATTIPAIQHLDGLTREELAALGDRIWEALSG